MSPVRSGRVAVAGLFCAVFLAFLPALKGGYIWDDREYVLVNESLLTAEGLARVWTEPRSQVQYYPLVHTVLWLEHRLWGKEPLGYHLVNILLHAVNAVLLLRLLERLGVAGAWLIAAIFGLHPVQAETVAWISELKNTLSGFFSLCTALAYVAWSDRRAAVASRTGPSVPPARLAAGYALALGLFVLALLSKTTAATLPGVLLALVWWRAAPLRLRDVLHTLPFFALGALAGSHTWWLETFHVGARGAEFSLTLAQRLLVVARALWFYPAQLLWPAELVFIYPRWEVDPRAWWQYGYAIGAAAVLLAAWRLRPRAGRGPLAALLAYLLTIMPVSGAVNFYFMKYSFVGDHFQYLACIGLIALVVAPLALRLRALRAPLAARLLPAALAALFAALSWRQSQSFRDDETLWRTTLSRNPSARIAHNNLGETLKGLERTADALAIYRLAVSRWPDDPDFRNELALLLAAAGDPREAAEQMRVAARLNPGRAEHFYNLGNLLSTLGDLPGARQAYLDALERSPDVSAIRNNFGVLLMKTREWREAREQFSAAVRLDPGNAEAARNLAKLRMIIGDR